jgi:hypothetical protein
MRANQATASRKKAAEEAAFSSGIMVVKAMRERSSMAT